MTYPHTPCYPQKRSGGDSDWVGATPNRNGYSALGVYSGRRLARDWEILARRALAFLRLASIRLMFRKLSKAS